MKKPILLTLMALFCATALWAKPVTSEQAQKVAATFIKSVSRADMGTPVDVTDSTQFTQFYIFSFSNGGFVLVAGDDCVTPILAYSASQPFVCKQMPDHIRLWLQDYEEQIVYCKEQAALRAAQTVQAMPAAARDGGDAVALQWHQLLNGTAPKEASKTIVGPLLSTTWSQSPYYNNSCPYDDDEDEYTVAGCVAIAAAQIMKYHAYPTTGYGSHSYTHSTYGTLSANFGNTTYAWSSMPTSLSSSSTTTQVNAVATLVYHVGVAVEMDYGVQSSGAVSTSYGYPTLACAENAFRNYFKYKPTIHSVSLEDYSNDEWRSMLMNELDNSRPILYSGRDTSGGHAFVCDGYNSSNNMFHINWGWGSYCDGYYAIGSLNPASGGTGGNATYTFNLSNTAIIGIEPNTSFSTTTNSTITATANNSAYGSVTGGGSKAFGTTVSLKATANTGYRFVGWSDGYRYNPREFVANGGSYTFTANFEPLAGDTISYCGNNHALTSFGSGGTTESVSWGIKIPTAALTNGHDLKKVQLYTDYAGTYSLNVYVGSTSSASYTSSYTVSASNAGDWNTFTLSSPVTINGNQPVWITFTNTGVAYPATMTYSAGSNDALLWGSSYSTIADSWDYSFMIRGIFEGSGSSDTDAGDTLTYVADSTLATNIGAGGAVYWGVSFPPSMLTGHNYLEKVLLYVNAAGTYTMSIYSGNDTLPTTLLYSKDYTFSATQTDYQECAIDTILAINQSQELWVTFYNSGINYPAAACYYMGNGRSNWVSLNGSSWASLSEYDLDYSWLIQCVTSATLPAATLTVSGPEMTMAGDAATYTASVSHPGYSISWSLQGATPATATGTTATATWSTTGTYNVIATATSGSTVLKDTLVVTVFDCSTVTSFPYTMGFESNESTSCWTLLDADDDGWGWMLSSDYTGSYPGRDGSTCLMSASYENSTGVLTPDNWAITQPIALPAGATVTLTWYDAAQDENYASDKYSVYAATSISGLNNASALFTTTLTSSSWTQRTANLSSFAGQTVYIAFRHYDCTDMYWLKIDDIELTVSGVETVFISCTGQGSGSIQHSGSTVNLCGNEDQVGTGQSVTYNVIPDEGSLVEHIYVNNTDLLGSATPLSNGGYALTVTISESSIINVVFGVQTVTTYTVTVVSNDEQAGYVIGGGTYEAGATATVRAIAYEGATFSHWSDNSAENPRSFTVTGDVTLTAYFIYVDGIDIAQGGLEVSLYPNPASEQVTVTVANPTSDMQLTLVDALGREVAAADMPQQQARISLDLSGLARGVYFLRLTDGDGHSAVRKVAVR